MKNHKFFLTLVMAVVMMAVSPLSLWAMGGSGTSSSPYTISSASDWDAFRNKVNSSSTAIYAKLTGNFTIESGSYTPVGTSGKPFKGELNGQGYTITLTNAQGAVDDFGLFGYVNGATIQNLKVAGTITVSGTRAHIGGIVGQLQGSSTIKGCTFSGTLDAGSNRECIGCIVGYAKSDFSGSITNCFCEGTLKTTTTHDTPSIGGILGYFNDENTKKPTIQYNFSDVKFMNGTSTMRTHKWINGVVGRIRAHADNVKYNTCINNGNTSQVINDDSNATIDNTNKTITISVDHSQCGNASKSYVAPTATTHTLLKVVATPFDHCHFVKWSDSGDKTHTKELTSDISVTATFAGPALHQTDPI